MPTSNASSPVPIHAASVAGLTFQPPEGWAEQAVVIYAAPRSEPGAPSLAVTRWSREPDGVVRGEPAPSFAAFVGRHLTSFARRLARFELLAHDEMIVDGCRAVRARFRAMRGDRARVLEELIVYVDTPHGEVVSFGCTFGPGGEARANEAMERLLATVRFRSKVDEDSGVRRAPLPPPPQVAAPEWKAVPMPGQRRYR
jgi:hypothetical protein